MIFSRIFSTKKSKTVNFTVFDVKYMYLPVVRGLSEYHLSIHAQVV